MTDFHGFMPEPLRGPLKNHITEVRKSNHGFPLGAGRVGAIDAHLTGISVHPDLCRSTGTGFGAEYLPSVEGNKTGNIPQGGQVA
ncbi:MAG: hypothetical protein EOP86_09370 [Verrucomicrobiaceae bacterium]|nr:MAG: hypothetical protein EOP86_09370 [Verrucomicrobiaceae bacterium]